MPTTSFILLSLSGNLYVHTKARAFKHVHVLNHAREEFRLQ